MGSGRVSIWGGEGVSGGNGILSISNRWQAVCNIIMPSVLKGNATWLYANFMQKFAYSCVPNKRIVPNKSIGWQITQI